MDSTFSRRVYRLRRIVLVSLAAVTANLGLRLASIADPAIRYARPAEVASAVLAAVFLAGSVVLLVGTRAWKRAVR